MADTSDNVTATSDEVPADLTSPATPDDQTNPEASNGIVEISVPDDAGAGPDSATAEPEAESAAVTADAEPVESGEETPEPAAHEHAASGAPTPAESPTAESTAAESTATEADTAPPARPALRTRD